MTMTPPPGPAARLPILETVAATFRSVLIEHIRALPRAALVPVLLSLILLLIQVRFGLGPTAPDGEAEPGLPFGHFLISLASVVPYVIFAVAWHRLILLGPERGRPSLLPSWGSRHWMFLLYGIALGIVVMAVVLILAFGGILLGSVLFGAGSGGEADVGEDTQGFAVLLAVFAMLSVGLLMARLSFVLPARSVDERYGLGDAWRQSRGQGFRILLIFALVQIVIALPSLLVFGLLGIGGSFVGTINEIAEANLIEAAILFAGVLPLLLLGFLASYLSTALGVTTLSIAFKTCSGWRP